MHRDAQAKARVILLLALTAASAAAPALAQVDPPTQATIAHNRAVKAQAPFADRRDFAFADRGYMGTLADPVIRGANGRVVKDLNALDFLKGETPDTVNPSLWRQSQLTARHGLYRVTDNIYQVRGFDAANITFVRGKTGWIVIDTLSEVEPAKAAYDLISTKVGRRPVTGIIYTHVHSDHTGGGGAFTDALVPGAPILAPAGFSKPNEGTGSVLPQAGRRLAYQFGMGLDQSPTGLVGLGVSTTLAGGGTRMLLPPTREIEKDGEEVVIDGVRLRFQLTPNTESTAEMNIAFPDWKVLHMAENANNTQHHILTPRGAVIRDVKAWADGLTKALVQNPDAEVLITAHGWPRFGAKEVADFLGKQRDLYAYLHDQTIRYMNKGMTGEEIAAALQLSPALEKEWYDRPYYGSFSFNTRAVYQYFWGWYDGNPVNLAPLSPVDEARRYVAALGGAERVRTLAQSAYDAGDFAWGAELLNRAVFADARDTAARTLLARCYEQLAWQSENAVWRNAYLAGARELRGGLAASPPARDAGVAQLPPSQIFDVLATRLDPEKAGNGSVRISFVFSDAGDERQTVTVANGVLVHYATRPPGADDAEIRLTRAALSSSLVPGQPYATPQGATLTGDVSAVARLFSWIEAPPRPFPIVSR